MAMSFARRETQDGNALNIEDTGLYLRILLLTSTQVAAKVLEEALYRSTYVIDVPREKGKFDEWTFKVMSLLIRTVFSFNASEEQSAKNMNHCAQFINGLAAGRAGSFKFSTIGSVGDAYVGQSICKERLNNQYSQHDAIIFGEASQINDANARHVLFVESQVSITERTFQ